MLARFGPLVKRLHSDVRVGHSDPAVHPDGRDNCQNDDVTDESWGWAGSARDFLTVPRSTWQQSLADHLERLLHMRPSQSQIDAWSDEHDIVATNLRALVELDQGVLDWGLAFEYELPLEGGRRPDVVVLTGERIAVLEFKSGSDPEPADLDQVRAYARDLGDYHARSHGRLITPMLVMARGAGSAQVDDAVVTDATGLGHYLYEQRGPMAIELDGWLRSEYEPLPTLIAAAKRVWNNNPPPHVTTALSAGIPEALDYLLSVCRSTESNAATALAFVTGVPGSGKTLLGLRLVYEGTNREGRAAFLSGNGPLVDVLQHALGGREGRVFVRDLHKVILDYGKKGKVPREHILVFDEAQRAWDRRQVSLKHGIDASEPDLLVRAGERIADERIDGWSVLVGLVGEGQEIYVGEEAGMEQWAQAIEPPNAQRKWEVHCAPKLAPVFAAHEPNLAEVLDLTVSLRSRRAEYLHQWVAALLAGDLASAARMASRIRHQEFTLYLTRDLDDARRFLRERYDDEPDRRYGLVATSHDDKLLPRHGVENGFQATRRVKYGPWYDAPADDPRSCCALREVVTEFGCQGLELDMPVVCWGSDFTWTGTDWSLRPKRRRGAVADPEQLLLNTYRVLLTRGRDGFVVYLPPADVLDTTEHALLAAGVLPLPIELDLMTSVRRFA